MRDGILLSTDVYLPGSWASDEGRALPAILERTPYDKSGVSRSERTLANPAARTRRQVAEYFASRGFAVVMQDCRGRYASAGVFEKYVNEAEDGFDSLAWIVDQSW